MRVWLEDDTGQRRENCDDPSKLVQFPTIGVVLTPKPQSC